MRDLWKYENSEMPLDKPLPAPSQTETAALDVFLAQLLCCPACADRPALHAEKAELLCKKCGRTYPVKNGVPFLLVEAGDNA